jgi:hypothetical protein
VEFGRDIIEDDLVGLHSHQHWPNDHDYAGVEDFRFDTDGNVVEDWDVLQVVPDRSAKGNGMFSVARVVSSDALLPCLGATAMGLACGGEHLCRREARQDPSPLRQRKQVDMHNNMQYGSPL